MCGSRPLSIVATGIPWRSAPALRARAKTPGVRCAWTSTTRKRLPGWRVISIAPARTREDPTSRSGPPFAWRGVARSLGCDVELLEDVLPPGERLLVGLAE